MGYPFPIELLPSFETIRDTVPVTLIEFSALTPTQYYLRIDRLLAIAKGEDAEGGDVPHVVTWRGKTYLYDGHHRWAVFAVNFEKWMAVRNVVLPDSEEPENKSSIESKE